MLRTMKPVGLTVATLMAMPYAKATNPQFQDFFFDVCVNPTGQLAARCEETTGGLGNISGDSESSLNPSQNLSSNDGPLSRMRMRSKQTRERNELIRQSDSADIEIDATSKLSLFVNLRSTSIETDKVVDVDAERGLETDNFGTEVGLDYRISDRAVFGAILGFDQTDTDFVAENPGNNFVPFSNAGNSEEDAVSLSIFGTMNFTESFYIEGGAGYSTSDFDFRRNSVFQESGRVVPQTNVSTLGSTDGNQTWAAINFGLNKQRNALSYGPYFGATWSSSEIDAYAEQDLNGTGLAMAYQKMDRDSLISHVGFRVGIAKSSDSGVTVPQFRIEYEHESDNDPTLMTASFLQDAAATQYSLLHDEPDRDHFEFGFGVVWIRPNGWIPFLDIEVLSGNDTLDRYRLAAGFRVEF